MSSETLSSVRGMNDLLPPETERWHAFEDHCRRIFESYAYGEIRTPILESTALFKRGVGETTDIVEKEMYTFDDRKGRSLTLRPEMTASCVRAYIQHSVHKREPVTRWYYSGPMFRYERMQTGRYRQFYQIGVEVLGVAAPTIEIEMIGMLYRLYKELAIDTEVQLNSVGGKEDRPAYRAQLVAYFTPHRAALCGDCQRRLDKNPLRLLDCKVPACRTIIDGAPSVIDALGERSRAHFEAVQRGLERLGVPFVVTPRMVRGLDYYTGTVFEFVTSAESLARQNTLVAGGRYDDLVEDLGGPATPAIGFSIGVERALLVLGDDGASPPLDVFIVSQGHSARELAVTLAHQLRIGGLRVDIEHRDVGFKAQFKRANKLRARYAVTIGEAEVEAGVVKLKNMMTSDEQSLKIDQLAAALQ
jgi:histidyl-tRNA synthetase